jgi:tRNA nucleotidyltransferase (CCA-adding enzyme)
MGIKKSIRDKVGPMVARHLAHVTTTPNKSNVRKLARDIAPASIEELARLIEADHSGRPPLPQELPRQAQDMLDIARKDGVANGKPTPIVQGKHVLPYYGGASGRHIGTAVQDAYSAYINGAYDNFEGGQQWLSNYLQSRATMLKGADVIALGVKPGPVIGQILNEAWQMQVSGVFTSRDDALAWLSRRVSSDATLVQ